MSLIQDRIVITRPQRVLVEIKRDTREIKDFITVNEVVAEWWLPEGAEIVLEPWIEHGVRTQGWKVTRHESAQVVPEGVASDGSTVNWKAVAASLAEAVTEAVEEPQGPLQAALDGYQVAVMFEAEEPAEPAASEGVEGVEGVPGEEPDA